MPPQLLSSDGTRGWIFVTYPGDPGSINDNRSKRGRHWSQDRAAKREWEGLFLTGFMKERLPKRLTHVKVWVQLQFDRNQRRDPENFRQPYIKPFADSLVVAGYLTDDTLRYFEVADFAISDVKLATTKAQKAMGLHSCSHVAMLYRTAP